MPEPELAQTTAQSAPPLFTGASEFEWATEGRKIEDEISRLIEGRPEPDKTEPPPPPAEPKVDDAKPPEQLAEPKAIEPPTVEGVTDDDLYARLGRKPPTDEELQALQPPEPKPEDVFEFQGLTQRPLTRQEVNEVTENTLRIQTLARTDPVTSWREFVRVDKEAAENMFAVALEAAKQQLVGAPPRPQAQARQPGMAPTQADVQGVDPALMQSIQLIHDALAAAPQPITVSDGKDDPEPQYDPEDPAGYMASHNQWLAREYRRGLQRLEARQIEAERRQLLQHAHQVLSQKYTEAEREAAVNEMLRQAQEAQTNNQKIKIAQAITKWNEHLRAQVEARANEVSRDLAADIDDAITKSGLATRPDGQIDPNLKEDFGRMVGEYLDSPYDAKTKLGYKHMMEGLKEAIVSGDQERIRLLKDSIKHVAIARAVNEIYKRHSPRYTNGRSGLPTGSVNSAVAAERRPQYQGDSSWDQAEAELAGLSMDEINRMRRQAERTPTISQLISGVIPY